MAALEYALFFAGAVIIAAWITGPHWAPFYSERKRRGNGVP